MLAEGGRGEFDRTGRSGELHGHAGDLDFSAGGVLDLFDHLQGIGLLRGERLVQRPDGPVGTPTSSSFFRSSFTGKVLVFASRRESRASRFFTRMPLFTKRGSLTSSGSPNAWQVWPYKLSFPAAMLMYPSLQRKLSYGAIKGAGSPPVWEEDPWQRTVRPEK